MRTMNERREIYERTEARRLQTNLTHDQIREMAKVANLYFDLKGATPSKSDDELLDLALSRYGKLVNRETYFARNGRKHVSELRMSAVIGITKGKHGGIDAVRPSGSKLVYTLKSGQQVLPNVGSRDVEMPDYDNGYPMGGGWLTGDREKAYRRWDVS